MIFYDGQWHPGMGGAQKAMGSYRRYSSLVKLQPWFLSLWSNTCLRQNCRFFMIMMASDIRGWVGPKFARLRFTVEKKTPEKPQPGKFTRPGIESQRWSHIYESTPVVQGLSYWTRLWIRGSRGRWIFWDRKILSMTSFRSRRFRAYGT